MKFKPHHYQELAIQHIIDNPASGLFLQMGLGKTASTLLALDYLMHDSFEVRPGTVLIIAPLRVAATVWDAEIRKWGLPLTISKILGTPKQRLAAMTAKADLYIINRENVDWLVKHWEKKWPYRVLVIDELSSFKSSSATRFKQLRKVRPLCSRVIGLTGTPAPNTLMDLWAPLYLLDRGTRLEKTLGDYRRKYFTPGATDGGFVVYNWVLQKGAAERIYEKVGDICVSMKAADWLEMPERIDNRVEIELDQEAYDQMAELQKSLVLEIEGEELTAETAASLAGKMLQMASGAVYTEDHAVIPLHDSKLEALDEIIEGAVGEPVLVFYWHRHMLTRLQARYTKGVVLDKAGALIPAWNAGDIPLLFVHPASAGHGLNLQDGGHTVVWVELTWSLELYEQANARLHRQGQTQSVVIHHLLAAGTIDEDVMDALAHKEASQNRLMEAVKRRLNL